VISQPNPEFGQSSDNPLSVLGQALFPPGNTNAPMEQLQQFYHLGVQAMSKTGGADTRGHSASATTGMTMSDDDYAPQFFIRGAPDPYMRIRLDIRSGGSRKKYLGGLVPHHLGGNNG